MIDPFENARKTAELLKAAGERGDRLNSKAKVKFANANGGGEVFVFGDRVVLIQSHGRIQVIKA